MIAQTCPKCGHVGHPTTTRGRFLSTGPEGYQATLGVDQPLRSTRAEAEADQCAWQAGKPAISDRPIRAALSRTQRPEEAAS